MDKNCLSTWETRVWSPGPGRLHATEQCSLSAITEPSCQPRAVLCNKKCQHSEKPAHHKEEQPLLSTVRESYAQPRRPSTTTKINYFLKEKPKCHFLCMIPKACHGPQVRVETSGWRRVGCICYLFVYYGMASVLLKMSVSIPQSSSGKRVRRELHPTFSKMEWILINTLSSVGSHFLGVLFLWASYYPHKKPQELLSKKVLWIKGKWHHNAF